MEIHGYRKCSTRSTPRGPADLYGLMGLRQNDSTANDLDKESDAILGINFDETEFRVGISKAGGSNGTSRKQLLYRVRPIMVLQGILFLVTASRALDVIIPPAILFGTLAIDLGTVRMRIEVVPSFGKGALHLWIQNQHTK